VGLVVQLLNIYTYLIIARILLSYFPIQPGSIWAQIFSAVYAVTEPVLGPVRRTIPAMGMFDLSPMIVIIAIQIIASRL
jgi:YggT family protein